jgi:hypothetical protein
MLLPALKGKAGRLRCTDWRSLTNLQGQLAVFADFFLFAALSLLAENKFQDQYYWSSIRETKE